MIVKLLRFILLLQYFYDTFARNETYFITAPNLLITETPHAFNIYSTTDLIISIETFHQTSQLKNQGPVHIVNRGYTTIPYHVPFVGNNIGPNLQLIFRGDICTSLEQCQSLTTVTGNFINKTFTLGLVDKNFIIFAETDKPIYKPDEKVKLRFMPIYPTNLMREPDSVGKRWEIISSEDGKYQLKEVSEKKKVQEFELIYIENVDGVRVAQWQNVNIDQSMNLEYQLTKDPAFGQWKAKATFDGQEETLQFTVKKYVLPRFVVEVHPPDEILADAKEIKFKICAKYSTGNPMEAQFYGTFGFGFNYDKNNVQSFKSVLRKKECETIVLKQNASLASRTYRYGYGNSNSVINVTVTENGTSLSVSKVVEGSEIKYTPYEIKFEGKSYFKPGLPYSGQVKLVRHNKEPQRRTIVQISVNGWDYQSKWGFNKNYTSNELGLIDFTIPFIPIESSITIQIQGVNGEIKDPMSNPSLYQTLSNWESVDKQYLQIQPLFTSPKCPGSLNLKILTNYDVSSLEIYAQVLSRGQITDIKMFSPVENKCESRNDVIGHYTCNRDGSIKCRPGWKGDNCREPICRRGCQNGACVEPNKCICKTGWGGNTCDVCLIAPYCKNGYCLYGNDCQCHPGWRNYDCSRKGPLIHYYFQNPTTPAVTISPIDDVVRTSEKRTIFERQIEIPLTKTMGPEVRIVVYFINPNWEVVADSVEITSGLTNCAHLGGGTFAFDQTSSRPKSNVKLTMDSGMEKTSCAVRISDIALSQFGSSSNADLDYLVRRLIELNNKIAIDTRSTYNNEPVCIDQEGNNVNGGNMGKRMFMPRYNSGYDSSQAFATSGFTTITNARVVNVKCQMMMWGRGFSANARGGAMMDGAPMAMQKVSLESAVDVPDGEKAQVKKEIRDFFPESWLFSYFNQTKKVLSLTVPDSMTTWKADAYCMTEKGLWIAPSQTLKVVIPFFADIYTPYSMKLDETLSLPVKLFNYADANYEIKVDIEVNGNEIEIIGNRTVTLCVSPNDVKIINFNIKPKIIGNLNITVDATSRYSTLCSKKKEPEKHIEMQDAIRRQLLVEPQGTPTETTLSELICNKNEQFGIIQLFSIPTDIVNGSLRSYLTFNGDVMGQTFDNLDKLVKMPYGCGEQNMMAVVPSIYVLEYLKGLKIVNRKLEAKAKEYILQGYTRQMTYKHDDGSFSAFGKSDKSGSTWLTSFVLRSFSDANKYVNIDRNILDSALKYLEKKQSSNGCFKEDGKLFSSALAGGVETNGGTDESLLTAYILISLKNVNITQTTINIDRAVSCVESALLPNASNYRLALTGYALSLHGKNPQSVNSVMDQLKKRSVQQGRYQYWPFEIESSNNFRPNSLHIETTGYAFLALQNHQSLPELLKTVYWISNQRNSLGGYYSTQDTVVALNALAVFAEKIGLSETVNIDVSIVLNKKNTYSDVINGDNRLVTRTYSLGSENISYVSIKTKGVGCVSIQLASLYNIDKLYSPGNVFRLNVRSSVPAINQCSYRNIKVCFAYLRTDKNSNMALVTIDYPSGWQLPTEESDRLQKQIVTPLNRIDFQNTRMELYYDAFSYNDANKEYCFLFKLEERSKISDLKPAQVRIIDYYSPELYTDASYTVDDAKCNDESINPKVKDFTCPKCINDTNEGSLEFVKMFCNSHFSGMVKATNKHQVIDRIFYEPQYSMYYEWTLDLEPNECSCLKTWSNIKNDFVVLSTEWQSLEEKLPMSNNSVMFPLESLYSAFSFDLRNQCSSAENFYTMMNRVSVDFSKKTVNDSSCATCILSSSYYYTIKNMTEWYCTNHTYWNLTMTSVSPNLKGILKSNETVVEVEMEFPNKLCYCQNEMLDLKKKFRIIDLKNNIKNLHEKQKSPLKLLLNNDFQVVEENVIFYNRYIRCGVREDGVVSIDF